MLHARTTCVRGSNMHSASEVVTIKFRRIMLTGEDEEEDEEEEDEEESEEEEEEQAPPPKVGHLCYGWVHAGSCTQVRLPVDVLTSQGVSHAPHRPPTVHPGRRPPAVHPGCNTHHSVRSAHSQDVRYVQDERNPLAVTLYTLLRQYGKAATAHPRRPACLQVGAKRGAQTPQPSKPQKQAKQEPQTAPPKQQAGKGGKQAQAPAPEAKGAKAKGAAKETPAKGEKTQYRTIARSGPAGTVCAKGARLFCSCVRPCFVTVVAHVHFRSRRQWAPADPTPAAALLDLHTLLSNPGSTHTRFHRHQSPNQEGPRTSPPPAHDTHTPRPYAPQAWPPPAPRRSSRRLWCPTSRAPRGRCP